MEVAEIGIYMAIVSLVMPLSLFVVVPVFTGKLNIRDRDGNPVKTGDVNLN